jgi:selenocysteine lyase/cysteine desulfurase
VSAGGWFHLEDPFGPDRFERSVARPGAAGFTVGMPNYPAVYAIRAGLDYIKGVGVAEIDRATRPLVLAALEGLTRLPVELLTPHEDSALAGILAFRHPRASEIANHLRSSQIHLMSHAGRLRIALHGYNTMADVETFLRSLDEAVRALT